MSKHHNPMAVPHSLNPKANYFIQKSLERFDKEQSFTPLTSPPWKAEFFQLDQSKLFNALTQENQQAILDKLSLSLLLDSFGIEKIGITYCGRISSTAPTMEERQLFSMMGADEAIHYQWLSPYIPNALRTTYRSPILQMMEDMLTLDAPNLFYYLTQIILEGWSIRHYKALSSQCQDATLTQIIKQILKDESSHHYTGKVLFDASQMTKAELNTIIDNLKLYTDIIRLGTSHIVQVVDEIVGLTQSQRKKMLADLNHDKTTAYKLAVFKHLMNQPGMESVVADIEEQGYFETGQPALA